MSDPNVERETVVHNTTVNTSGERRSGGGFTAFAIVGLLIVLAVIAWFVIQNGAVERPDTNVDVKVEAPELPDINLPEPKAPSLPG